jgi:hypothetical protein
MDYLTRHSMLARSVSPMVFRDGKVARVEGYFDRREGLRAAGLRED